MAVRKIMELVKELPIGDKNTSICSLFTSTTGVSASINHGCTNFKAANINLRKGTSNKSAVEESRYVIDDIVIDEKFKNIDLIFIDEISMCNHQVLFLLDRKLKNLMKNDEDFGGICVVLCGDFYQCRAVKCKQLPKLCLDLLHKVDSNLKSTNNGAYLFTKFRRGKLETQVRISYLEK